MDLFTSQVILNYPEATDNSIAVEDSVKAVGVKIEAARSGKVNGNLCFYTPKAMRMGVKTFLEPFPKHIQVKHNGEALGPVTEAEYVPELFPKASYEFLELVKKINKYSEEGDGKALAEAVDKLISTPEYRDENYRGLGIANIYGDIWDPQAIHDIKTRDRNKGTVSIGGKSRADQVFCSICGEACTEGHEHVKGTYYDDKLCFHIHNDLTIDHCGFVTVPADRLTNTEVVKDEDQGLTVDITFKTGKRMDLEQLKEAIKDASAVKSLLAEKITDTELLDKAFGEYESLLKNSRSNHYLFSTEKLLNLRSVFGISVAESLIEKMSDEDSNKACLQELVKKAKIAVDIEDTEQALQKALDAFKEPEVQEAPTENQTEETPAEPSVAVKDMQMLFDKLVEHLDSKFSELSSQNVKVEDSQNDAGFYAKELVTLRETLDADELVIKGLQENYKSALIELIKTKKGGELSEEYLNKLSQRTTEGLKQTLEDLDEELATKATETVADTELPSVSKDEAFQTVKDQLQNQVAEEHKEPEQDAEPETKDADESVKVEDSLDFTKMSEQEILRALVKEHGFAKAKAEFKKLKKQVK